MTPTLNKTVATIKARRVAGGAIVRVIRDGREHRHRVSLRRYNRLRDTLAVHRGAGGWFMRGGFEAPLAKVAGLRESREWAQRRGNPRAKHWRDHVESSAHAHGAFQS